MSAGAATRLMRAPPAPAAPRRSRFGTAAIDPAPSVSTASPGRAAAASSPARRSIGLHHAHRPAGRAARRLGQRLDGDARNRLLAGRVDVGQHDLVGVGERRTELVHQPLGPRVAVRLERHHEPPAERHPRRGQHGGNLGRVMAVVVHDQHAVGLAHDARTAARRRGSRAAPPPRPAKSTPSSTATATAASAFCRLCRPGTASSSVPSRVSLGAVAAIHGAAAAERPQLDVRARDRRRLGAGRRVVEPVGHDPPGDRRGSAARTCGSSTHATTEP